MKMNNFLVFENCKIHFNQNSGSSLSVYATNAAT